MTSLKFKKGDICKIKEGGLWSFKTGDIVCILSIDKNDNYQPYYIGSLNDEYREFVNEKYLQKLNNNIQKLKEN